MPSSDALKLFKNSTSLSTLTRYASEAMRAQETPPTPATLKAAYLDFLTTLDSDTHGPTRLYSAAILAIVAIQLAEENR